jgi:aspartate/methionine/tyrosine aminotransferase
LFTNNNNSVLAEHLSRDLPYKLCSDDIFLTAGGTQAIEVIISVLSQPDTNILLPKPGYPNYKARATFNNLEVRHFDLIPEKGWEIDVDSLRPSPTRTPPPWSSSTPTILVRVSTPTNI